MRVHPTAHVHAAAEIDPSTEIGPGVIIEAGVTIGPNNRIWPNVYIGSGTTIGADNEIHMNAVIGHVPQDLAYDGAPTGTRIGDRNIFRENVTVHRASKPDGVTRIGSDCLLMVGAHVAHDCRVGNGVTLTNGATLGGHVRVDDGAFLSGFAGVHQFVHIGRLVMLSPLSTVIQDIPPFSLAGGLRAQVHGVNVVGLRRAGLTADARARIQECQRILYRSDLTTTEALAVLREDPTPETCELVAFVEESRRGISRFGVAPRDPLVTSAESD